MKRKLKRKAEHISIGEPSLPSIFCSEDYHSREGGHFSTRYRTRASPTTSLEATQTRSITSSNADGSRSSILPKPHHCRSLKPCQIANPKSLVATHLLLPSAASGHHVNISRAGCTLHKYLTRVATRKHSTSDFTSVARYYGGQ